MPGRIVTILLAGLLLLPPATAGDFEFPGLSLPASFRANEQLSVGGQAVWTYIRKGGDRDMVAVTPPPRPRSIDILRANGYRSLCRPADGFISEVLFSRQASGSIWFLLGRDRSAHVVVSAGSRHYAHFSDEISAICNRQ